MYRSVEESLTPVAALKYSTISNNYNQLLLKFKGNYSTEFRTFSENFYGAIGASDMADPQSYLASEADRLWVSVYDGFSRMAVPLFMIVSAYLLVPMKKEQTS